MEQEEEKSNKILKNQLQELEDDINKLKAEKHGTVTNVFKMAEKVGGAKKQKEEAHAMKDPETGETVVSPNEIKRLSLEHCVKVLQKNPIEAEAELWVEIESKLHESMMKDDKNKVDNIEKEEFDEVVSKFKKKNKPIYRFFVKAGKSYITSKYKLCKKMIKDESFPDIFSQTMLKQLWKKKGSRHLLDNYRVIHLKDWKPRRW